MRAINLRVDAVDDENRPARAELAQLLLLAVHNGPVILELQLPATSSNFPPLEYTSWTVLSGRSLVFRLGSLASSSGQNMEDLGVVWTLTHLPFPPLSDQKSFTAGLPWKQSVATSFFLVACSCRLALATEWSLAAFSLRPSRRSRLSLACRNICHR